MAVGHNQNMLLDFWFSFFVLSVLRLNRRNTPLALSVSALLGLLAFACGCDDETGRFLVWLSSAAWMTAFVGFANRQACIGFFPIMLLPLMANPAGPIGLLTGAVLNLPRGKARPPKETYGIHRLPMRSQLF